MSANPDCLLPQLRNDTSVRPPYSNVQVSETALHREMLEIYRLARPETRAYYNLGHSTHGLNMENWIIKWLLWHVFRYRDNRNRGRVAAAAPVGSGTSPNSSSGRAAAATSASPPGTEMHGPMSRSSSGYSSVVEPKRVSTVVPFYVHVQPPYTVAGPSTAAPSGTHRGSNTKPYWDPVRDAQRTKF